MMTMSALQWNHTAFRAATECGICHQSMSIAPYIITQAHFQAFQDMRGKSICQECARYLHPRFVTCIPNHELSRMAAAGHAQMGVMPAPTQYPPGWVPPRTFQPSR